MIRLFIVNPTEEDVHSYLIKEIIVPQTTQSDYDPSFKQVIPLDLYLYKGYQLGASTQNAENFAVTVEGMYWRYAI